MTDTAGELAQARAVLAARTSPDLPVLKAVHSGLVSLPDRAPHAWKPDHDDEARAAG
ncbi:MAG: hypothetical protein ACYCV4_20425 [Dermatophilaceae bacterium]